MTATADVSVAALVARGYDRIAEPYMALGARTRWGVRPDYLAILLDALPAGSRVLDLGCGCGLPVTRALAARHQVLAVDLSEVQAGLARRHAPTAAVVVADAAAFDVTPGALDAVAAFYTLTHIPRERHVALLRRVFGWLRPGGLLVATMGADDQPGEVLDDFLGMGAPMYGSHFDAPTNRRLVADAGFHLRSAEVRAQQEDGRSMSLLWVVAERVR